MKYVLWSYGVPEFGDLPGEGCSKHGTGALRPGPDAVLAGPAFEQWLDSAA